MIDALVWTGLFDGRFEDRAYATQVFADHIDEVQAHCDPDRLLVFDVAQGWTPLCEFLGVPVPDHDFPHLNDAASLKRRFFGIRYFTQALPFLAGFAVVAAALRKQRQRSL